MVCSATDGSSSAWQQQQYVRVELKRSALVKIPHKDLISLRFCTCGGMSPKWKSYKAGPNVNTNYHTTPETTFRENLTCFQPAEAIWARLRPSFCAEMQKAIGGKGSKWSRQPRLKEPFLTFLISNVIPTYGPPPALHGLHWPSNLDFGHARKAAESAQRSREAMQQMSACKCTWRFDAAFDCPRFILFPFVFGANRKSL